MLNHPETEETFRYLTDADWQLLMEKARKTEFARGEMVVEEGETSRNIFLIARGGVRLERQRSGRTDVLAQLGPGQVFGEVAFADRTGAGASVIAEEPTEMEMIIGEDVDALLQSVPGFATRFYMSLAATLARRLRATAERALR